MKKQTPDLQAVNYNKNQILFYSEDGRIIWKFFLLDCNKEILKRNINGNCYCSHLFSTDEFQLQPPAVYHFNK